MCDPRIVIIHNVQNITSSHDSTYKTDIDTRLMEAGMPESCMIRTFYGPWNVRSGQDNRSFGPRNAFGRIAGPPELRSGAFRPTLTPVRNCTTYRHSYNGILIGT